MRRCGAVLGLVALLVLAHEVHAQEPGFSIEMKGGYGVPVGEWAEDEAVKPGFGFGAGALYTVVPNTVRIYFGYDRYTFDLPPTQDPVLGPLEGNVVNDGLRGGARALLPGGGTVVPFAEGGVIYQRVSTSVWADRTRFGSTSERALGFEAGAGFIVDLPTPAAYPVRFVSAARYRQHPLEYRGMGDLPEASTAASVVIEIGISVDY